jgi:glycosyltransferase involved in cell wall biosynthesis
VKKYVDEMIVVDTGSSDKTSEIAVSYGAKVYHQSWQQNFSEARNFSIDRAKGNWILILDADEVLVDGESLMKLASMAEEHIDGFLFNVINYYDEPMTKIEKTESVRLFRNRAKLRFFGAANEQLPLKAGNVVHSDLFIHHYGYIPDLVGFENRANRVLKVLLDEIEKVPEDPSFHYTLGKEYVVIKNYDQAVVHLLKALNLKEGEKKYEAQIYKLISKCFLALEVSGEFKRIMDKGIKNYPDYPDLYYFRAKYCEKRGELLLAVCDLMKCLSMEQFPIPSQDYNLEEGITSYKAHDCLGKILDQLSMGQEALTAYARSLQIKPLFPDLMKHLKNRFTEKGEWQFFLEHMVFEEKAKLQERMAYARHFLSEGDVTIAFSLLDNLEDQTYVDEINFLRGIGHFLTHNFEQTIGFITKIPETHPIYLRSIPYLTSSLWMAGHTEKAIQILFAPNSPAQCLLKTVELLILEGKRKMQEGIQKYPASEKLKKVFADELQISAS